jgi:Fe-S cluster assembly protein SufD
MKDTYLAQFDKSKGGALADLRRRAIDRFATLGFPTGAEEEWRFTDVSPIAETAFAAPNGVDASKLADLAKGPLKACQFTFIDGRFAPSLSSLKLPKSVAAGSLASFLAEDPKRVEPHLARHASFEKNAFAALNTAFVGDGVFLHIPRGVKIEEPVHLLFLSAADGTPVVSHPRVLVIAEEGAHATIVESYLGPAGGTYFTNAVTEIVAREAAVIDYYKVQRESPKAYHVATVMAHLGRNAALTSHSISLGAALARNDIGAVLDGEGAEVTLNGLYEASATQLVDHHTSIDHAKPHGTSRELYKGILNGKARGVFDGKIVVRPDAQKTNAVQTNKNLLLSKDALVNTKPQLEINANDVKCKHGATIGQLDRDMLFYMRSRGIGHDDARRLLVHAFASEIIDEVKVDAIRTQLGGCLHILSS